MTLRKLSDFAARNVVFKYDVSTIYAYIFRAPFYSGCPEHHTLWQQNACNAHNGPCYEYTVDRGGWGQNTFGANVNRDLEGRTISDRRPLVTSSVLARGSWSVIRVFGGLVSCAEICNGEVLVVKFNP